jgi:two-component sensor histidine kinase
MLTLTLLVLTLLIGWHLFNYYSLINPLNDFKENEIIFMEINYTIIMVIFVVIPLLSYRKITTDYQKELSDNVLEKEMLLKEIHHRVKNNLQLIISMLGLQENKALFLESKEMIKDLKARVISMAIIHRKLYQKDGVSTLNLEEYIRQLTDLLIETYKEEKTQLEKTIDIEPITVGLELSIPLGLIITEVISNSFKHAFKLNKTSYLEIIGYKTTHGFFILKIKDNGMGLPLDTDQIDSLGFSLIKMLCNQIEAKLERLNNQGLETTITFKL